MKKVILISLLLCACIFAVFASGSTESSLSTSDSDDITKRSIASFDGEPIGVQTAVLYEELIMDKVPNTEFQY